MTVQSTVNKITHLVSDIGQTEYIYDFRVDESDQMIVFLNDVQQSPGDYIVNDLGSLTGGTITISFTTALNDQLLILREMPLTQLLDYITYGKFPSATHEKGLDYGVMIDQQLEEQYSRVMRFPVYEDVDPILPSPQDQYALVWQDDALVNKFFGDASSEILIYNDHDLNGRHLVFGSIDELEESAFVPFDGQVAKVTGFAARTENRDWEFTWYAASTATADRGLVVKNEGIPIGRWHRLREGIDVDITWYGAIGDGVTDSTVAIQAACATGFNVFVPSGRFIITSTVTVATDGQGIYGAGGSVGGKNVSGINSASTIEFDIGASDPETQVFLVTGTQVTFSNLKIFGDSANVNDICFKFQKISNTDDMDGYVLNCTIISFKQGVYTYGRGMQIDTCTFSAISDTCVVYDWPTTGEEPGSSPEFAMDDRYKGRGIFFTNNRIHSALFAIRVKNYLLRGPIIEGNQIDIGRGLLIVETGTTGESGIDGGVISANEVDFSVSRSIVFEPETVCKNLDITGNVFAGAIAGTVDGIDKRPVIFIDFDAPKEITNLNITGNTFKGSDSGVFTIRDIAGGATPPTTLSGIHIVGNTFNEIGLDGVASRYIFLSIYDIDNFTFNTNTIINEGATVTQIIDGLGSSIVLTNSSIMNNIYDPTIDMFSSVLLAGTVKCDAPITYATLSGAGSSGSRAFISDSNTVVYHAVVAGGGANPMYVYSDGTDWRAN